MSKNEISKQDKKEMATSNKVDKHTLNYVFETDEEGDSTITDLILDGETLKLETMTIDKVKTVDKILHGLTGLTDTKVALSYLLNTASSLKDPGLEAKFRHLVAFLEEMKPKDPIEARLLSTFLTLNDNANLMMKNAGKAEMMNHGDYFYRNSMKAANLSLQAIQTLVKYRSKGTQQINIMHMHDNSKAVVANKIEGGRGGS